MCFGWSFPDYETQSDRVCWRARAGAWAVWPSRCGLPMHDKLVLRVAKQGKGILAAERICARSWQAATQARCRAGKSTP